MRIWLVQAMFKRPFNVVAINFIQAENNLFHL